jgi:protein-S-isoprenylcysteine O-methyltransferase Ste14
MPNPGLLRQLRSLILPITVAVIIPMLLVGRFRPFGLRLYFFAPLLQILMGAFFFCGGLLLLVITIRLFATKGKGTLAPWDPPQKLITENVYRYVRNPMISGVLWMLVGETVFSGSWLLLIWALIFGGVNTLYFRLLEEPQLARRFGEDYLEYRSNVPMWVPRLNPWIGGTASAKKPYEAT